MSCERVNIHKCQQKGKIGELALHAPWQPSTLDSTGVSFVY